MMSSGKRATLPRFGSDRSNPLECWGNVVARALLLPENEKHTTSSFRFSWKERQWALWSARESIPHDTVSLWHLNALCHPEQVTIKSHKGASAVWAFPMGMVCFQNCTHLQLAMFLPFEQWTTPGHFLLQRILSWLLEYFKRNHGAASTF